MKINEAAAMAEFDNDYEVVIADTPELIMESYRLRYQVYCLERNFLAGSQGIETDEFDEYSRHVLLVCRESREVVGSARLILGSAWRPHSSFPMQQLCNGAIPAGVAIEACAEVSRFAVSKLRRSASTGLMRLALVRGLVQLSSQLGIVNWCAVMEPTLLRLLRATSIVFHPFGPLVEYHGLRQPCWNSVSELLDGVGDDRPELFEFLTRSDYRWTPGCRGLRLSA